MGPIIRPKITETDQRLIEKPIDLLLDSSDMIDLVVGPILTANAPNRNCRIGKYGIRILNVKREKIILVQNIENDIKIRLFILSERKPHIHSKRTIPMALYIDNIPHSTTPIPIDLI